MKADAGETGILERPVVAPAQQRVVLDLADLIGEHEIVGTSELLSCPSLANAVAIWGPSAPSGRVRTRAS